MNHLKRTNKLRKLVIFPSSKTENYRHYFPQSPSNRKRNKRDLPEIIPSMSEVIFLENFFENGKENAHYTSWFTFFIRWTLFTSFCWMSFGIGWLWAIQGSCEKQTKIYFQDKNGKTITSFQYRLMNELYLIVLLVTTMIGTWFTDRYLFLKKLIILDTLKYQCRQLP